MKLSVVSKTAILATGLIYEIILVKTLCTVHDQDTIVYIFLSFILAIIVFQSKYWNK